MAPRLEELHPPVDRRAARPAATVVRPPRRGHTTSARDDRAGRQHATPTPVRPPPPSADRGLILLIVFTASALTMVGLVVVIGAIGQWWTLVPVMAVDFAVTAAVLVTVAKLLEGGDAQ